MLIEKFPYQKLNRNEIDGKRYYSIPNGNKLPSVTTILDITKSEEKKQSLENWRNRIGREEAERITALAAERGNFMHSYLENYIIDGDTGNPKGNNPFSLSNQSHKMAHCIIQNGLKNVKIFYASEAYLYYDPLYAGTTDCVFLEDDEIVLGDFKNSIKPKKDEWLDDYKTQCCGYIISHDFLFGTNIKKGKIMMVTPNLEYQEWIITGNELAYYKDIWWSKVEKYYLMEKENGQ